ncbi:uncharacterized protein LOC131637292 [Vicia villosa]|uniref:uncharacterized protein LOC131637292 n=1 Tax=Vicia villosa TaxID=3911 RepID=UPI00273A807C|nr:uncharacterized protein LOC131637292 [Vicia villosa]
MIVAEAGSFTDGGWEWSTDSVFTDSSSIPNRLLEDLFDCITPVTQRLDVEDKFVWSSSGQQVFTVKSCYDTFKSKLSGPPLNTRMVKAFKHLWKVKAPPKILFFGWRIIHNNRLSTKYQLHKRGMSDVSRDLNCVFCLSEEECPSHLLGGCEVVSKVWKKVYEWMDYGEALTLEEFNEFFFVMEKVKNLSKRFTIAVIWLATTWCIWNRRNAIIFTNASFRFTECISDIMLNSGT